MATARAWGLRGSEWRTQPRSRPACPASKNKRNKVSSTPEVSGTRHKPGPDASGFSIAIDLGTRLHRSWVPASKRKGCPALLGKTSVSPRSTGLGQLFLPVRAQRPGRSGIRRSVGAAPSRNGERSWADREHARPVPGRMKARHLPKCNGATSKLCIALLALASLRFARLASLPLALASLGSPRSPQPSPTELPWWPAPFNAFNKKGHGDDDPPPLFSGPPRVYPRRVDRGYPPLSTIKPHVTSHIIRSITNAASTLRDATST